MNFEDAMPKLKFPRTSAAAWCTIAFEEIEKAISFIDLGANQMTKRQRKLWKRYKKQTLKFAHDTLLALKDDEEIGRRLKL